jgi:hypothetical protein
MFNYADFIALIQGAEITSDFRALVEAIRPLFDSRKQDEIDAALARE